MRAPLVPSTIAFACGILLSATWFGANHWVAACGALSVWLCCRAKQRSRLAFAGVVGLWLCLGIARFHVWQLHPAERLSQLLPREPAHVRLHGFIRDDPISGFEVDEARTQTCVLDLRSVYTGRAWRPIAGRVRATFHNRTRSDPKLSYGDEVLVEGFWSGVPAPTNPGQYDWRAALARQRIHGLLRVRPHDGVAVLSSQHGHPVVALAIGIRHRWEQLIRGHFNGEDQGLLLSLLLGQRVALNERLKDAFVQTGTVHLLIISGFNVGLIALMLELGCRLLGLPWRAHLALIAIALALYAAIAGFQPPVLRATIMAWMVLGAMALDRVINWWNVLAAAALFILWATPTQLFDPSFQLSFGAVASLLGLMSRLQAWLEPRLSWLRPPRLMQYVTLSLATTGAIWIGLFPILAWYFHMISPVSLLANLLIAPLMSLLISLGTGLLLLGSVCEPILHSASSVLHMLLQATIACVRWCDALPGGSWDVGQPALGYVLGYYGLLLLWLLRPHLRWSLGCVLGCWLLGLGVWAWGSVTQRALSSRWLQVDVLDVGHGDCLVVRTPAGHTLIIDAGTQDAGRYRLVPFLRHEGITTIDALVLTHSDEDHLGGAVPLLQALWVKRVLTNGVQGDTMSARQLRRLMSERRLEEQVLVKGMRLDGDSSVRIEVLHPPAGLVPTAPPASNDNSVVLKMSKGAVSFLFTGDLEEAGLPWLLQDPTVLRSTVLKVPHHGSRLGGLGDDFFGAVYPQLAIVSVGRLHRLPAQETLEKLIRTRARLLLTRKEGAIRVRTDGTHFVVKTFRSSDLRRHPHAGWWEKL